MNLSELLEDKRKNSSILRSNYFSLTKNKSVWIIDLKDNEITENLLNWLKVLPSNFIIISDKNNEENIEKNIVFIKKIPKDIESWIDFIVTDNNLENLKSYLALWICPILPEDNYLSTILEEFNPVKVTWNSYIYKKENQWEIFYAIVKYLENYKFPYDNRNLVKNLFEI